MKIRTFFSLILTAAFSMISFSEASLPRMHIFLAEKCLEKRNVLDQDRKSDFLLGNLFPDIRYLGVISREKTHESKISLEEVFFKDLDEFQEFTASKNSIDSKNSIGSTGSTVFIDSTKLKLVKQIKDEEGKDEEDLKALQEKKDFEDFFAEGMRFHSWVDEERERFLLQHPILEEMRDIPVHRRSLFLKLVEDEMLVERGEKFDINCLWDVHFEELKYVTWSDASKWHLILSEYFLARPSRILYFFSQMQMSFGGVSVEELADWSEKISVYLKKPKVREYFRDLVSHFERKIGDL